MWIIFNYYSQISDGHTMRFSRKSIPTVDINLLLNVPSVYRYKKVVFPTPESPEDKKQHSPTSILYNSTTSFIHKNYTSIFEYSGNIQLVKSIINIGIYRFQYYYQTAQDKLAISGKHRLTGFSLGFHVIFYKPARCYYRCQTAEIHVGLHLFCIHYESWQGREINAFCVGSPTPVL